MQPDRVRGGAFGHGRPLQRRALAPGLHPGFGLPIEDISRTRHPLEASAADLARRLGTDGSQTHRWREIDSNFKFRAK